MVVFGAMLEEIRRLLKSIPFIPFRLETSSGRVLSVPHPDHILISRKGLVAVETDDGLIDIVPALHLNAISYEKPEANETPNS